jgi:hypothetical protein
MNPLFFDETILISDHELKKCEEYPFINYKELEIGTEIFKLGYTTGLTRGYFLGYRNINYIDSKMQKNYVVGIAVQWPPETAFTKQGDSGCVYYAVHGSLRYPLAVHAGCFDFSTDSTFPGGKNKQRVSVGTPLSDCLQVIANSFQCGSFQWKLSCKFSDLVSPEPGLEEEEEEEEAHYVDAMVSADEEADAENVPFTGESIEGADLECAENVLSRNNVTDEEGADEEADDNMVTNEDEEENADTVELNFGSDY